mmetsp:Transcript_155123/g.476518  ORF Transcript_155123/g.476518 Transcript_155123/m.476518 type:complete len:214 (-) Transcript_155123:61-702(-)
MSLRLQSSSGCAGMTDGSKTCPSALAAARRSGWLNRSETQADRRGCWASMVRRPRSKRSTGWWKRTPCSMLCCSSSASGGASQSGTQISSVSQGSRRWQRPASRRLSLPKCGHVSCRRPGMAFSPGGHPTELPGCSNRPLCGVAATPAPWAPRCTTSQPAAARASPITRRAPLRGSASVQSSAAGSRAKARGARRAPRPCSSALPCSTGGPMR